MANVNSKHYGLMAVGASWLAIFCLFGYRTTFAVLQVPLSAAQGWTNTQTSLGLSIMMLFYASTAFLSGKIVDKWGTRPAFALAAIFGCLGFLLTSFIPAASLPEDIGKGVGLIHFYLSFSVFAGIATGMLWVSSVVSIRKWYVGSYYAKMFGFAFMGGSVALVAMNLIVKEILQRPELGWRTSLQVLSMVILLAMIIAAILARKDPQHYNMEPAGLTPSDNKEEFAWSIKQAFSTYPIWSAILVLLTSMLGEFVILSQVVRYWTEDLGIHIEKATYMFVLIGICGIFCSPLAGFFADKIVKRCETEAQGRKIVLIIGTFFGIITCLLLLFQPIFGFLGYIFPFAFVIYWTTVPSGVAAHAGSVYGRRTLGTIWGLATLIIMSIGPFGGAFIGASLADSTGNYTYSIIFAICAYSVAMIIAATMPTKVKIPQLQT